MGATTGGSMTIGRRLEPLGDAPGGRRVMAASRGRAGIRGVVPGGRRRAAARISWRFLGRVGGGVAIARAFRRWSASDRWIVVARFGARFDDGGAGGASRKTARGRGSGGLGVDPGVSVPRVLLASSSESDESVPNSASSSRCIFILEQKNEARAAGAALFILTAVGRREEPCGR